MFWHKEPSDVVLKALDVNQKSVLSSNQINVMRVKHWENEIISTKEKSRWILLREQFSVPVIYILIAAAEVNVFFYRIKRHVCNSYSR